MMASVFKKLHFNPSRTRLEEFLTRCAASTPGGAVVLDAGAGEGFYKRLFAHTHYHATDFCKIEKAYGQINFISVVTALPVKDNHYDAIICTQVLEHLPEPQKAISEMYRVLKPGGRIFFSTPLFFQEHEVPFDFFRYTRYGLARLFESAGFCIEEIDWMEGYFATLGYQCRLAYKELPLKWDAYGKNFGGLLALPVILASKPLFYFLALFFNLLEGNAKYTQGGMCKNHCGIAVKPAQPQQQYL
jgi:SAM-dependent methyltransferase